jgi:hypothetical protein
LQLLFITLHFIPEISLSQINNTFDKSCNVCIYLELVYYTLIYIHNNRHLLHWEINSKLREHFIVEYAIESPDVNNIFDCYK